jgi:hypothetical protein
VARKEYPVSKDIGRLISCQIDKKKHSVRKSLKLKDKEKLSETKENSFSF